MIKIMFISKAPIYCSHSWFAKAFFNSTLKCGAFFFLKFTLTHFYREIYQLPNPDSSGMQVISRHYTWSLGRLLGKQISEMTDATCDSCTWVGAGREKQLSARIYFSYIFLFRLILLWLSYCPVGRKWKINVDWMKWAPMRIFISWVWLWF